MRRKICFVIAALVVVMGLAWELQTRVLRGHVGGEPFYGGRPASYWARELKGWKRYVYVMVHNGEESETATSMSTWNEWHWPRPAWQIWVIENTPWPAKYLPRRKESLILDGDFAALEVLTTLLEDNHPRARCVAAYGLGMIGAPAMKVVPCLLQRLNDGDADVRDEVNTALRRIDPVTFAVEWSELNPR